MVTVRGPERDNTATDCAWGRIAHTRLMQRVEARASLHCEENIHATGKPRPDPPGKSGWLRNRDMLPIRWSLCWTAPAYWKCHAVVSNQMWYYRGFYVPTVENANETDVRIERSIICLCALRQQGCTMGMVMVDSNSNCGKLISEIVLSSILFLCAIFWDWLFIRNTNVEIIQL